MEATMARVTAVFDDQRQAEQAISALRRINVSDAHLSVIARHHDHGEGHAETHGDSAGARVGKGAIAGASIGALFGLAAALIPGVGPFITAGAFASTLGATGGAAAAGAIVGGTSGAIAGALTRAGYSHEEAEYYGPAVERGGVLVAADTDELTASEVRSTLAQYGGRTYARQSTVDRDLSRPDEFRV
jgi:uncharacterized membrane protein